MSQPRPRRLACRLVLWIVVLVAALPAQAVLEDPGDGTLIDACRGMVWAADGHRLVTMGLAASPWLPIGEAVRAIDALNRESVAAGAVADWRLPTPGELAHLFEVEGADRLEPGLHRTWLAQQARRVGRGAAVVLAWPVLGAAIQPGVERAVVLATNSARIKTDSEVVSGDVVVNDESPGPTLVNGYELVFEPHSTTAAGWAVKADSLRIKNKAVIGGDASFNALANQGTILGTQTQPLALPVFALLPPFRSGVPGAVAVTVPPGGFASLPAGAYGAVLVEEDATLVLAGGVYDVAAITLEEQAQLLLADATQVRVAGRLAASSETFIGPEPGSGVTVHDLVFYVAAVNGGSGQPTATPFAVSIGERGEVAASLYAPHGTVGLGTHSALTGAVVGRDVLVEPHARLTLDSYFFNRPPVAVDEAATVDEGGATTELDSGAPSVLANDSDPDGDPLSVDPTPVTAPEHGSLSLAADGTFTYTHDGSETTSDSFAYRVCDDGTPPLCDTATVAITVNPVNDPPAPQDDAIVVELSGTATTLVGGATSLLANDTDPEGDGLAVDPAPVAGPSFGFLTLAADGTFSYTHGGDENQLADSFQYQVCDDGIPSECATATVAIVVRPPILVRVDRFGLGGGTVTSSPAGIDCGATCAAFFPGVGQIVLTATADPGSTFGGWSGDGDCTDGILETDGDKLCLARFDTGAPGVLTVTVVGDGTVISDTGGIACPSSCSASYPLPSRVELTATAATGWTFVGWSGDPACEGGQVSVLGDTTCVATFEELPPPPATFELTLLFVGSGSGAVSSFPAGLLCNEDCVVAFPQGTSLILSARPDQLPFGGWGGDCTGTDFQTTLLLDADKVCTVEF